MYRFWKYASSVLTRRPSPRRPWFQVRWDVPWTEQESWPLLLPFGSGQMTGDSPMSSSLLPLSPAGSCYSDLPYSWSHHGQVKKSLPDVSHPQSPTRQKTVPEQHVASHLPLRSGAETSQGTDFFPTGSNRSRSQNLNWFQRTICSPIYSLSAIWGVIWLHLQIQVWPTFQVESRLECKVHIGFLGARLTPSSG